MEKQSKSVKIIVTGAEIEVSVSAAVSFASGHPETAAFGRLATSCEKYKAGGACRYFTTKEIEKMFLNRQFIYLNGDTGLTTFGFEDFNVFAVPLWDIPLLPQRIFAKNDVRIVLLGHEPRDCVAATDYTGTVKMTPPMRRQVAEALQYSGFTAVEFDDAPAFNSLLEKILEG